ncbi:hypothetical protein HCG51_11455 [Tolypothrix sp. PCC 7910]|uniref:hypothetical protein n=1 Tax=Tolypothrix sp. PCC 7910 TaxID=2099387 RepID=UPI0014279458|nr:hypothetical protein [Tolypothrix sp. PCC 7910]QIR37268.1 hypothetical protein HCG51_11455 [Tolypothrix sp. PCC 7910]
MKIFRFLSLLLLTILTSIFSPLTSAQHQPNLPARAISISTGKQILIPDWQRISFTKMPPIQESGLIKIDGFYRKWNAGDTPDKYLTLGDIETVLKPQLFSLSNIANIINYPDENTVTFDSFPLVGQQTLQHLAQIVPNLSATNTATIKPVAALLKATYPQININTSLATLLSQNPTLGSLKLNQINLSSYKISDIPNLDTVQLSNFTLWQNALIKDIPRLNAVPLAYFPVPIAEVGNAIARIDFIWGTDEKRRQRTVSGSDVAGFSVPCSGQKCPYIELDDLEDSGRTIRGEFEGRSWISGKYQQVAGGWGCLKSVNAGKEPTGRLPYGSAFKVVVMEPNEQTDTFDTAIFFRFKNTCGATPYFIGPVPFITYKVNSHIFLGNTQ